MPDATQGNPAVVSAGADDARMTITGVVVSRRHGRNLAYADILPDDRCVPVWNAAELIECAGWGLHDQV